MNVVTFQVVDGVSGLELHTLYSITAETEICHGGCSDLMVDDVQDDLHVKGALKAATAFLEAARHPAQRQKNLAPLGKSGTYLYTPIRLIARKWFESTHKVSPWK